MSNAAHHDLELIRGTFEEFVSSTQAVHSIHRVPTLMVGV
jgi:hypothetical protein